MARKPVVLVTGAGGEMGHTLIRRLAELAAFDVLALDVRALESELARCCAEVRVGDVLDRHLIDRLMSEFEISVVFHLAALLSTRGEFVPETAHQVNVEGTLCRAKRERYAHADMADLERILTATRDARTASHRDRRRLLHGW